MTEIESTRLINLETMQDVIMVKITLLLGTLRGVDWTEDVPDSITESLEAEADVLLADQSGAIDEGPEIAALIQEWRALEAEARPLRTPHA